MNQLNKKKNITPTLISAALAAFIAQPSLALHNRVKRRVKSHQKRKHPQGC